MKKLCRIGFICILLVAALVLPTKQIVVKTGVAEEYDASVMYVVNCDEWVSLRSSPSTSAFRIAQVPLGAAVQNCQTASPVFTYCTYNGMAGYVLTEYLSVNAPMAGGSDNYVGEMRVVNCNDWVSLRSGPSTKSSRVAQIPLGAVLMDCTRYSSQFIYGNYNGQWGYVLTEYLSRVPDNVTQGQGFVGDMVVVNCDEWVSLREEPSTSASRIATVPLGAVVTNCSWYSSNFICCEYNGMMGYILSSYLQPAGENGGFAPPAFEGGDFVAAPEIGSVQPKSDHGRLILEHAAEGYTVFAYYNYGTSSETVYVECLDGQGVQVWQYTSIVPYTTELQCVDAFMGGSVEMPLVMVYNADGGLFALDFYTGEVQWNVSKSTVNLGGSISHAVTEDGTVYVGGYYGPDPVAIDVNGRVLWQAKPNHDAYWMHKIEVTPNGIIATYDCIDEHEAAGQITYGFDGAMLNVIWF